MKISRIHIRNILGISELEFEAGKFNALTGVNGSGKTSVLNAIKAATQCGHDATLLRKGEKTGEVVLVLDNHDEIRRRVTADSTKTDLIVDGKKQPRAVDAIKALTDSLSVNPVDFLRATEKDRTRVLLESMPLSVDAAKLARISGVEVDSEPGVHGLQVIEVVRKTVYDDRTGTNRAVSEKQGTINQLRSALPAAPEGVEGDEASLQALIDKADAARQTEVDRIAAKLAGIEREHQALIDKLKSDASAAIDRIRAEAQLRIDAENRASSEGQRQAVEKITNVRAAASNQRELANTTHTETVAPLREAKAVIAANREAAAARRTTLATIERLQEELTTLEKDAAKQTKALSNIELFKAELLASLPIPGITVEGGQIMRDGVPFDRLNTAQQVQIAVDIAKLRAGDLGVICVDGIELLDTQTFDAFRERAIESGLQMFVSRVSDQPFTIEVDD